MKSFAEHAATKVVLKRGAQVIELNARGPVVGWETELDRAYPRPVDYKTVSGKREEIALPDAHPRVAKWVEHRIYLMAGKILAEGGELEQVYPAPLPTDPVKMAELADSIRAEMNAANLRDGDLTKLMKAYYTLQHGDLPTIAQAQAEGNASQPSAAT